MLKKKKVGCTKIHIYSNTRAYKLCYLIILEFQPFNQTENQPPKFMSDETFSTSNASLNNWLPLMTLGLTKICTNQWWLLRWVSSLNLICRSKPINLSFLTLTHYSSYVPMNIYASPSKMCLCERDMEWYGLASVVYVPNSSK